MTAEVMTAQATGNTNTSACLKARSFQLTLNEVDKYNNVLNYLNSLKSVDYIISCREIAPTTGHKHIHIYIHCKTTLRLSLKKCCGAHVEICRGSPKQNIDYIRKDGQIIDEIGDEPTLFLRICLRIYELNDFIEFVFDIING